MERSIFEMIIDGDIPSMKVFEDERYIAILDINPKQQGHTLLIPKVKKENILSDPEEQKNILVVATKIAEIIKEKLDASGIRFVFNNGTSAGQEVFHTHLHIIPYYDDVREKINNEDVLNKING